MTWFEVRVRTDCMMESAFVDYYEASSQTEAIDIAREEDIFEARELSPEERAEILRGRERDRRVPTDRSAQDHE